MSLSVWLVGCSERHTRQYNQDRIFPPQADKPRCFRLPCTVAVADGMGGTEHGEQAAEVAVGYLPVFAQAASLTSPVEGQLPANWSAFAAPREAGESTTDAWLKQYFRYVNHTIVRQLGGAGASGSTLSLLRLDAHSWSIGHLGDSRIYLLRDNRLHQLTTDHNLFQKVLEDGQIYFRPQELQLAPEDLLWLEEQGNLDAEFFFAPESGVASASLQTPEALSEVLRGKLSQYAYKGQVNPVGRSRERLMWALGKEAELPLSRIVQSKPPEVVTTAPQPGDLFLLCSDGLCGFVSDHALQERLQQLARQLQEAPGDVSRLMWGLEMLLQDARDAESNDNISIQLAYISGTREEVQTDAGKDERATEPVPGLQNTESQKEGRRSTWELDSLPPMESPARSLPPLGENEWSLSETKVPLTTTAPKTSPVVPQPVRREILEEEVLERPPSHRGLALWERLFWLLLVVGLSWLWYSSGPKKTTPVPTPVRKVTVRPKASPKPVALKTTPRLLWTQVPALEKDLSAKQRLELLQRWNLWFGILEQDWKLAGKERELLLKALQKKGLSLPVFQALLKKYSPDENARFEAFDKELKQVLVLLCQVLIPAQLGTDASLFRKLPLPAELAGGVQKTLQQKRHRWLLRLRQEIKPILGQHWLVEWGLLLVEMPAAQPPAPLPKKRRRKRRGRRKKKVWTPTAEQRKNLLRRCKEVLKLLKTQSPREPVRQKLENWIQQLSDKVQR